MTQRIALSLTLLFLLMGIGLSASAHELPIERQMVLDWSDEALGAMLVYREPPGPRSDRLKSMFDANRDGRISPAEARKMGPHLYLRATHKLAFRVDNESVVPTLVETKVVRERTGGFSVAFLISFDQGSEFEVSVIDEPGVIPLNIAPLPSQNPQGFTEIRPGQSKVFRLRDDDEKVSKH